MVSYYISDTDVDKLAVCTSERLRPNGCVSACVFWHHLRQDIILGKLKKVSIGVVPRNWPTGVRPRSD